MLKQKKRFKAVLMLFFSVLSFMLYAKQPDYYKTLYIQKNMNSYVHFTKAKLLSIDVGGSSSDILWAVDKNNIVKFKALRENFPPTNMLVTTHDTIIEFKIMYGVSSTNMMNIDLSFGHFSIDGEVSLAEKSKVKMVDSLKDKPLEEAEIIMGEAETPSEYLGSFTPLNFANARAFGKKVKRVNNTDGYNIFSLIYFTQDRDFFYWTVQLNNRSPIEFPIDYVVFEVKGNKPAKKSQTSQSFYARYVPDSLNAKVVYSQEKGNLVFSTRKFAIRRDETLRIRIFERSVNSKGRQYEIGLEQKKFINSVKNI